MKIRDALATVSIAITSLTAGSIFCFPLFGPTLTRDLGLNLAQTNTLWGGSVLGEYLTAAIWGVLADRYGPRLLSASASVLFLVGYQLMSRADTIALHVTPLFPPGSAGEHRPMATGSFIVTLAAFTGIGSGVAASYFSAVTASTRLFASSPGIAIAGPLTLFSFSSLFLTSVGARYFSDGKSGDLDAPAFLSFLGWLLGATNAFSTLFMRLPLPEEAQHQRSHQSRREQDASDLVEADEETSSLLGSYAEHEGGGDVDAAEEVFMLPGVPQSQSLFAFLSSPAMWVIGLLMVVGVGASEMVLSSVGNMVVALVGTNSTSLPASPPTEPLILIRSGAGPVVLGIRATQVKLLAGANAASRLAGGLLSDLVAPPSPLQRRLRANGGTRPRRWQVSRLTLLLGAVALLSGAFAWAAFGLRTVNGLPIFSVIVGVGYGLIFTLVPAVTLSAFGNERFGRNWGILSYCCAAGSMAYSFLYAFVSDAVTDRRRDGRLTGNSATCIAGPQCFQPSFIVSLLGMATATVALVPVWRKWSPYL